MSGKRRWICLAAGVLIELLAGLPYSWSVFQNLLSQKYDWPVPGTALAYSLSSVAMLVFTLLFASVLFRRAGIRRYLLLGCLCYAGGTLGCGLIQGSLWELYLYYGLLIGVGTAILYPALTAYAVRLFPQRPGFASGMMVAGYGCGPFVLAPIIARIYDFTGDVSQAFLILGAAFLVLIGGLSLLIREPEAPAAAAGRKEGEQGAVGRGQMMRQPRFYLIYGVFAVGIVNGTMLLTQVSPILQDNHGMAVAAAAGVVGAISLSNTVGRMFWGVMSDRLGKPLTVLVLHLLSVVSFLPVLLLDNVYVTILALALCIFCFGGFSTLLAPATSEAFGASTLNENYSVMFSIFSLAGIAGPMLITGAGYTAAYLFGAVTSLVGVALAAIYRNSSRTAKALIHAEPVKVE